MNDSVVAWLDGLSTEQASLQFRKCCGTAWWCDQMAAARPFGTGESLSAAADKLFSEMSREGWYEAFASHPKIGDVDSLRMKLAGNRQWSSAEQAGVADSDEETLIALAAGNRAYEQRFGYIFIICASGLSAREMLAALQERMANDPESELVIAAEQQRKITHLRLAKLTPEP